MMAIVNENTRIAVDLDDVVFDLVPRWLGRWRTRTGQSLYRDQIADWSFSQFIDGDPHEFYGILREEDLYRGIDFVEGAINGIAELRNVFGYENVYFLTAGNHPGKLKELKARRILSDDWADNKYVVVMYEKELFPADILIDDKLETVMNFQQTGRHAILFDAPWNQKANNVTRAFDWNDVVEHARVAKHATERQDIHVNEDGGMQTDIATAFHLVDPLAIRILADTFQEGIDKGYEPDNWRLIPVEDHINHGLNHAFQALAEMKDLPFDETEDHLAHAAWRFHAAVAKREMENSD